MSLRQTFAATVPPIRWPGRKVRYSLAAVGLCVLVVIAALVGEWLVRVPPDRGTDLGNVAAALRHFDERAFHLDAIRAGRVDVPRLFAVSLPAGVAELDDAKLRKSVFIRLVLPLALQVNADLRRARERLLVVKAKIEMGRSISDAERRWLVDLAGRYGTEPGDFETLLRRVDTVPVSLVLAQAIEESGWGTSRFAVEGNALFGQRTWRSDMPGFRPNDVGAATRIKVRAFPDLLSSVRSYVHNLNTHWGYTRFRQMRQAAREREALPAGPALAAGLTRYSEAGDDYVERLRSLIRRNRLEAFDNAKLEGASR